jgi:hypothetical protein
MLKNKINLLFGIFISLLLSMFIFSGQVFAIDDVDKIIPTPQNVTYTENFMTIHDGTSFSACIVKGQKAPQAELEGIYFLQDAVSRLCGQSIPVVDDDGDYSAYSTIITIGTTGSNSLNDSLVKLNSISIPENLEGYAVNKIVSEEKNYVVIAGREAIGCYYGATSVAQMFRKSGDNVQLREVAISDWPSLSIRALKDIANNEGDFTLNDAVDWMKFLPKTKMNVFSLCYTHLSKWRTPSQEYIDALKTLGSYERDRGIIKIMLEINAGYTGGLPVNETEKKQLVNTYKLGLDNGISQIMCAFDDIYSTVPDVHRDLSNYIFDMLKGQDGFYMLSCPQAYNFDYSNISSYLSTFTNGLRPSTSVAWTGNKTWSPAVTPAHVNQWKGYTNNPDQWKPFFWNNDSVLQNTRTCTPFYQPKTYYFEDQKVPFKGLDLENGGYIWSNMEDYVDSGVIENIFRQFTADKVYAISFADWAWNPGAYQNTPEEFARAKRYWDTLVSNPAFNKTATASTSIAAAYGPDKVLDGLTTHRRDSKDLDNEWASSTGEAGQWLKIDLGYTQMLTGVNVIFREYPSGIAYCVPETVTIMVSNDDTDWTTVVENSDNTPVDGGTYNSERYLYKFDATDARYIKLVFGATKNTKDKLIELSEVEAVTERPVTKTNNFAVGKEASASSKFSDSYGPDLAVDGITSRMNPENCWATASGQVKDSWFMVDLGRTEDLRTIRVKFKEYPANTAYCVPKTITFQSSNDGTNWTTLISKSGNVPLEGTPYTSQAYSYSVNDNGRYVRLLFEDGTQNNVTNLIDISELEVSDMEVPNHQTNITMNIIDETVPSLMAGSVSRTSDTEATVKFTSNEAGQYYYAVVADGAAEPAIDTSGAGTACVAGETTINLTGLSTGAKDIYIKVKDAAGNVSSVLKMDIDAYQGMPDNVVPFYETFDGEELDAQWEMHKDSRASISVSDGMLRIVAPCNVYAHIDRALDQDNVRVGANLTTHDGSQSWATSVILYWDKDNWFKLTNYPDSGGSYGGWYAGVGGGKHYVEEMINSSVTEVKFAPSYGPQFRWLAIELGADVIRYMASNDGKKWVAIRTIPRPDNLMDRAPAKFMIGKGYSGGKFTNDNMNNSYSKPGSIATTYVKDAFIEYTPTDRLYLSEREEKEMNSWGRDWKAEEILSEPGDPTFERVSEIFPEMKFPREIIGVKNSTSDIGVAFDGSLQFNNANTANYSKPDVGNVGIWEVTSTPSIRLGFEPGTAHKSLLNGMPIVTIDYDKFEGLEYKQTVYAASLDQRPDETVYAYSRMTVTNSGTEDKEISLRFRKNTTDLSADWNLSIPAGSSQSVYIKVPFNFATIEKIEASEYDSNYNIVKQYWEDLLAVVEFFIILLIYFSKITKTPGYSP